MVTAPAVAARVVQSQGLFDLVPDPGRPPCCMTGPAAVLAYDQA